MKDVKKLDLKVIKRLKEEEHKTYAEIASMLGVSIYAVYSRYKSMYRPLALRNEKLQGQ